MFDELFHAINKNSYAGSQVSKNYLQYVDLKLSGLKKMLGPEVSTMGFI